MMKKSIEVKIINQSSNEIPSYATEGSAGLDLRANLSEPLTIAPKAFAKIPTGVCIELPEGTQAEVRSRSGLAFRHGLCVMLGVGTIDFGYSGEIGVLLMNHSNEPYTVQNGERVAQLVISEVLTAKLKVVEKLSDSERGNKGFGSTGRM